VPGFQGLQVDATEGERWELALSLLEAGEGQVQADGVILWRDASGPASDGRIHIEVVCSVDPDFLTVAMAEGELQRGLAQVDEMVASDDRFAALIGRCGAVREYVWNYGMGTTLLASVHDDGTISWDWGPSPRA
jgi:hypothetical protein